MLRPLPRVGAGDPASRQVEPTVAESHPERDCAEVEFCGELHRVRPGRPFLLGREGDLVLDDNAYLHRHFLELTYSKEIWWLCNVGSRLCATVADDAGTMQAWLAPGARLPLVVGRTNAFFTAGPTTYALSIEVSPPGFAPAAATAGDSESGRTTLGRIALTTDQRRLLAALAEPLLSGASSGRSEISSSGELARRLGWTMTRLNRKLDNVCEKLARQGVRGLHGAPGELASNRKARLAEYAVSTRIVTRADLDLLDRPA